jgi:hypothetical protein
VIVPGRTVALLVAVAIIVLGFKSGGYFPQMWSWLSFGCAFVLLVGLGVGLPARLSRRELGTLAALMALAAWTLLSASWSVDVSQSVREAERALLYAAAVAVVLAFADSVLWLAGALFAAVTFVVTYGLGLYLFASHPRPESFEGFLLFRPIGYANAVGIAAAMGILLALGLVTAAAPRALRSVAAAALVSLAAALVLSASRASALALAVGLLCMLAVERDRLRAMSLIVLVAPAPVLGALLSRHADLSTGTPFFRDGRAEHLGLELIVLTVAAGLGASFLQTQSRRTVAATAVVGGACVLAAVGLIAASGRLPNYGGPRSQYWHVAEREWKSRPLLGTGAGTFGRYWEREGPATGAQDAHNLYLETLAELGPVGLVLVLAALGIPFTAVAEARRNPLAPALFGAYTAYVLHAAVDWDWEMPVVTLTGLLCGTGLLLAARASPQPAVARRTRLAAAAAAAGLLAVSCVELVANGAIAF